MSDFFQKNKKLIRNIIIGLGFLVISAVAGPKVAQQFFDQANQIQIESTINE